MAEENVSAALTVAVPAARVFAVLADPTTHSAIDGTGWARRMNREVQDEQRRKTVRCTERAERPTRARDQRECARQR